MKNLAIIFLCVSISAPSVYGQLTGSAFLSGSSNHANIKVLFKALSQTAVTDSAFTQSDGTYSLNISGGIYNVTFYKMGYETFYYNNITPLALTNTMTMTSVTLVPGNLRAVSGNVSGTWKDTTYLLAGHCTVPAGQTLIINAGTLVKFNGNYSLTVLGTLRANGMSQSKITFTSNAAAGRWNGIYIYDGSSSLQYCIFDNAHIPVTAYKGNHLVKDCEFRSFRACGLYMVNSTSFISENSFHDFEEEVFGCAISLESTHTSTVSCNTIYNGHGFGIRAWSGTTVHDNKIYHIRTNNNQYGYGIWCEYYASGRYWNNYISDCDLGFGLGTGSSTGVTPDIFNNVMVNNSTGVRRISNSAGRVFNNIIVGGKHGVENDPAEVASNLFWGQSDVIFKYSTIPGIGVITGSNAGGHPVDSYNNLFQDPLFNNIGPTLQSTSPCFGSGDIKFNANIGLISPNPCYSIILSVTDQQRQGLQFSVSPNPFIDKLMIATQPLFKVSDVVLMDLNGRKLELVFELSDGKLYADTRHLAPGMYLIQVKSSQNTYVQKVIKQ